MHPNLSVSLAGFEVRSTLFWLVTPCRATPHCQLPAYLLGLLFDPEDGGVHSYETYLNYRLYGVTAQKPVVAIYTLAREDAI
jgi:hypothetical protein